MSQRNEDLDKKIIDFSERIRKAYIPDVGISIDVGVNEQGQIVIQFGNSVRWIALTPEQAMKLASMLIDHVMKTKEKKEG
jgi:hypothetical protein